MSLWIYSTVTLLVTAAAVIGGFRRGFRRQLPSLFGMMIGAVCAHIFGRPLGVMLMDTFPQAVGTTEMTFIYGCIGAGVVFLAFYVIFRMLISLFAMAFRSRRRGVFDMIGGAVTGLAVDLTMLSLLLNFIICMSPHNAMMRAERSDDGSIVNQVLAVAPALLGFESPADLAHKQQLEEAKSISL